MKIKWWRWWIVPLIPTILIEVGVAILLAHEFLGGTEFWGDLGLLLMSPPLIVFPIERDLVLLWPLFLWLVWPAALIIHGVWKRRKAKKQVSVGRAMKIPFRWWWVPTFLSVLMAAFLIFVVLNPPHTSLSDLPKALGLIVGIIATPVLSWELSLAVHGIWKKVRLWKQKDTQ
jgi:hypothetical protein